MSKIVYIELSLSLSKTATSWFSLPGKELHIPE